MPESPVPPADEAPEAEKVAAKKAAAPAAKKAKAPKESAEAPVAVESAATVTPPAADDAAVVARPKRKVPVVLLSVILIPILVLAAIGGWAAINRQYLADQWTVWNFEPTAAIADYVDDSTMTDHALFLFNASKPRVAADSEFNDVCGSAEGGDGALGCYTSGKKRIILFEIADDRLSGFQEAVASHEMLHAAWDRLGTGDRDKISDLLEAEAERLDDDADFSDQLRAFDVDTLKSDERYDELHSIIGTQTTGISDELEEYYAQYFSDRDALVGLYDKAHGVLEEIAAAVEKLNDELDALDAKITEDYDSYVAGYKKLNKDWDAFQARNQAYYYKSQRAFDIDRNKLIARGKKLDAMYDAIQKLNDEYNDKVEELSELDAKAAELYSAINLDAESANI